MRQFPRLFTRTLRALSLPTLMICAASAGAQNGPPPTATEAQSIQKCHDATTKTNNLIAASIQARTTAAALAAQIQSLTSDTSPTAAQTFTALAAAVRKLADAGLPAALTDNQNALKTQKDELTKACGADVTVPQELIDAQTAAKTASINADTEVNTLDTSKVATNVSAALDGIPAAASQIFDSLKGKIADLKNLPVASDKQPLADGDQRTLTRGLPALADVLEQMYDANPAWARLAKSDALTSVDARKTAVANAQAKATGVDSDLKAISTNLAGWVVALSLSSADPKKKGAAAVTSVLLDPGANSGEATAAQKDANQVLARINAVLSVWPRLSVALKEQPTINTDDLANNIATLSAEGRSLQTLVARLADALAGDMSKFVTEQVRLYYFTDVDRLMRALNAATYQVGGLAEAQAQAAAQRKELATAEFDLADAQGEVNRLQRSVLDLREQQRQQAASADAANLSALRLQNRLRKAQRQQQGKEDSVTEAQDALKSSPNDPGLQADLSRAQAQKDAATTNTTRANDQYTQAQSSATAANDQLDTTKADQNGVPAKLAQAQQALEAAQASVSATRRKMLMAAQAESEAFANARDHSPFWVADAVAADTDPIKHVIIFGFPDNATLVLRGKEDDVTKVKEMIAKFDSPAPQARLTLWSMEISSDMGQFYRNGGADNLNKSMEIVDEELGNTRSLVNATIDLLLTSISERVRLGTGCFTPNDAQTSAAQAAFGAGTGELDKWRRLRFFTPEVLAAFGFALDAPDAETLKHLLPDPSATTTLGEGLLMLALSCDQEREAVRTNFNNNLQQRLAEIGLRTRRDGDLQPVDVHSDMDVPADLTKAFARTWQVLGIPSQGPPQDPGAFTSQQFEITFALRDRYELRVRDRIIKALNHSIAEFAQARKELDDATADSARLRNKRTSQALAADELNALRQADAQKMIADSKIKSIAARDVPLLTLLYDKYKLRPFDIDSKPLTPALNGTDGHESAAIQSFVNEFERRVPSDGEIARVAAADEMIKKMIIAVEDDLDRLFVQPMIHRLRDRMLKQRNVRVGVLQRESMLATNRLVARIDPRASAQLQVGEEQDILGSVQQLAQLYLTAQSGGALGVLGALQKQPREKPPEIYGVGTGNTFQVTPIFDPSGQALRFKFDYVGATRITEPSGGVDPQLPRIERHTVNTEVQLSNLETREISRFEATSKIGIPSHYWGGVPILKDIPYVRPYVPLLGWFVRRAGQNAAAQQSVIFGQTTIYPSISDLAVLLSPTDVTESIY